jgi:hypothetical protein
MRAQRARQEVWKERRVGRCCVRRGVRGCWGREERGSAMLKALGEGEEGL